jgi:tetratricopeptide (TPR) repeat protein
MGSTVSVLNLDVDPETVSQLSFLGIKLNFLVEKLEEQDQEFLESATTLEVCEELIKPLTQRYQCSYSDYISKLEPSAVGEATYFISHVWSDRFIDVIDSVVAHLDDETDVIIWMDIFCINQHKPFNISFDWLTTTFKNFIGKFDFCLLVLTAWDDLVPFHRSWCLWEVACILNTNCQFAVAMDTSAEFQFVSEIDEDTKKVMIKLVTALDSRKSKASKSEDEEQIHEAIEKTFGFSDFNKQLFDFFHSWMIQEYQGKFDERKELLGDDDEETMIAKRSMSVLTNQATKKEIIGFVEKLNSPRAADPTVKITSNWTVAASVTANRNPLSLIKKKAKVRPKGENTEEWKAVDSFQHKSIETKKFILGARKVQNLMAFYPKGSFLPSANGPINSYNSPSGENKLKEMEETLKNCSEQRKQFLQDHYPENLMTLSLLARTHFDQKNYELAESLYLDCLKKQKTHLGENHPDTLSSLYDLAVFYQEKDDADKAETYFLDCLERRKIVYGEDSLETILLLQELVYFYRAQPNQQYKTEKYFMETLQRKRKVFGSTNDSHEEILATIFELACFYDEEGMIDKAEQLYLKHCEIIQTAYGLTHKDLLLSYRALAVLYQKENCWKESENYWKTVLSLEKLNSAENPTEIISTLNNLAGLYQCQEKFPLAEPLFKECYEKRKDLLGDIHPDTLLSLHNLSYCYYEMGKYKKAERFNRKLLALKVKALGEDHPETIDAMSNLAHLYEEQGKSEEAEDLFWHCYEKSKKSLGQNHPDTQFFEESASKKSGKKSNRRRTPEAIEG